MSCLISFWSWIFSCCCSCQMAKQKKMYCLFVYFDKSTSEVTIKDIVKEQKWNHWLGIAQIITEVIRYIMYITDSRTFSEASQSLCLHFQSHLCVEEKAVRVKCCPKKETPSPWSGLELRLLNPKCTALTIRSSKLSLTWNDLHKAYKKCIFFFNLSLSLLVQW